MNGDKEVALHSYIQDQIGKPFRYGRHDCMSFAAGAFEIVSGKNVVAQISENRKIHNEYRAYIKAFGSIESHMGEVERINISHIQTGDFVLSNQDNGIPTMGVCVGSKVAFNTVDDGVSLLPVDEVEAYRVLRVSNG